MCEYDWFNIENQQPCIGPIHIQLSTEKQDHRILFIKGTRIPISYTCNYNFDITVSMYGLLTTPRPIETFNGKCPWELFSNSNANSVP